MQKLSFNLISKKLKSHNLQVNQKGSAIFLVVLILAGILTVTIGINNLVLKGIKFSRNISWSGPAYYAAETGMEKALWKIRIYDITVVPTPGEINGKFELNGQEAIWTVGFICSSNEEATEICAGKTISEMPLNTTLTIKSTGSYRNVNRSIELSFCIKGDCKQEND